MLKRVAFVVSHATLVNETVDVREYFDTQEVCIINDTVENIEAAKNEIDEAFNNFNCGNDEEAYVLKVVNVKENDTLEDVKFFALALVSDEPEGEEDDCDED